MSSIRSSDYHDYVIKDGQLVGKFDQMYQYCQNPWPESEVDLDSNPVSLRTLYYLHAYALKSIFSLGCGSGMHLNWLGKKCSNLRLMGSDISPTAIDQCRNNYPGIEPHVLSAKEFCKKYFEFDVLLLREVIWYILNDWDALCSYLRETYAGRFLIVELSFYDEQNYGKHMFDGPNDFIEKFPFEIIEIVRCHVSRAQREGMIFVLAKM